MNMTQRVKGNVKFNRLEAGELWYVCEDGFQFPVALEDTHGAVFNAEDKGLYFMRWIRRHMEQVALYDSMLAAATE